MTDFVRTSICLSQAQAVPALQYVGAEIVSASVLQLVDCYGNSVSYFQLFQFSSCPGESFTGSLCSMVSSTTKVLQEGVDCSATSTPSEQQFDDESDLCFNSYRASCFGQV